MYFVLNRIPFSISINKDKSVKRISGPESPQVRMDLMVGLHCKCFRKMSVRKSSRRYPFEPLSDMFESPERFYSSKDKSQELPVHAVQT